MTTITQEYGWSVELIRAALRGRRQASLLVRWQPAESLPEQAAQVACLRDSVQALSALLSLDAPVHVDLAALLQQLIQMQQQAGLTLLEPMTSLSGPAPLQQFLMPAAAGRLNVSLQLVRSVMKQLQTTSPLTPALWQELREQLSQSANFGTNTPRLLEAAHALDLPVIWLQADIFQVGHGHRSRWLQSTFTDETSNLAVRLARQKTHTHDRLRQAGLPVADQAVVRDVAHAAALAARIGYPVVIKPADRDGGVGVFPDLRDEQALRGAYAEAARVSANIVLERHIQGRDYRLTVFHGELVWAVERQPAGITGDGQRTIQALIDLANQASGRQHASHSLLKPLPADEEAQRILAEEGMRLESIPDAGCFVPLRRNANVSSGGMPVSVYDRLHPDNARLAVHAVEALRLDVGGVDLILSDISRSWRDTGGVVCEVNAQPQLNHITAPHISRQLLQRLLPAGGRIPILVIAGAPQDSDLPAWLAQQLEQSGHVAAYATAQGVWLGNEQLADAVPAHRASEILLTNPRVTAAVISVADDSAMQHGLFADTFDWLILDGRAWAGDDAQRRTLAFAGYMVAHCRNRLITLAASPLADKGIIDKRSGKPFEPLSRAALAQHVMDDFGLSTDNKKPT